MRTLSCKRRVVDGFTFRDPKEASRYVDLKVAERSGKITELKVQKVYKLYVNGIFVDTYIAGFDYWDVEKGRRITEEAARFKPDIFYLKKKLMRACLGIDILET